MKTQKRPKRHTSFMMCAIAAVVLMMAFAACANEKKTSDEANQLMNAAYKDKDYDRIMILADSLEKAGALIPVSADYWRGYACDRMKRKDEAEKYWKKVIDDAEQLTGEEELLAYEMRSAISALNDDRSVRRVALPEDVHPVSFAQAIRHAPVLPIS